MEGFFLFIAWRGSCIRGGVGKFKYNMALVVANILFGGNFSFYVSLTRSGVAFQQIFMMQVTVAAVIFIPFAILSRRSYRVTVEDFGNIFIVAIMVVYGWMYMLLWGASTTSPIDASIIATLGPVFTLIVAHIVSPVRMSVVKAIGAVVALSGAVVLLSDRGLSLIDTASEGFGNSLVLCAVVAIATNTVLINRQLRTYGVQVVMGWYYIIGFVMAAPFFLMQTVRLNFAAMSLLTQFELFYVTVLGTVLPMWLLYVGASHLTAVHTALYRYLQPVVAAVLSVLRGQNIIDRANIVGAVLIFTGVVGVVAGNIISRRFTRGS